jgi:hypothetical protein
MQTEPELQMSMTDRKDALPAKHSQGRLVLTSQDDFPTGCANFEDRCGVDAVVLYHDNAKADARRIVQCWNSHDELVAALRAAKAELDYQRAGHIELRRIDRERLDHLARMAESAITNATQGEA